MKRVGFRISGGYALFYLVESVPWTSVFEFVSKAKVMVRSNKMKAKQE